MVSIDVGKLKAIINAAAKNDIRYYLNGVLIERTRMVATDGHVLAVVGIDEHDGPDVIIPEHIIRSTILAFTR